MNAWVESKIAMLVREAELENVAHADLSPELVIVFSTRALVGDVAFPDRFAFVGPALGRPENMPFPWDSLRDGKRILVSLGTVSSEVGASFFDTVMRAFEGTDLQVVLVAPADLAKNPPPNFIVQSRVPQLALLPKVHAVVCHAGHNTVCESLAHGLPLVVAPIRADQPVIAHQVVSAGAGLRVR